MILSVANQKGGVGKTITAVTLAHGAARLGLRVLLVDLDPQGNCADSLGVDSAPGLYRWLSGSASLDEACLMARPGLAIIPGDKTTAVLKRELSARDFAPYVLADALNGYASAFDLVILDCAPSLDILHTAALMASDRLLIPVKLDQFAVKGLAEIIHTLAELKRRGGGCALAGVLPTFYDRTTRETQVQLEALAAGFGNQVWPPIPQDAKIRTANRAGSTLYELYPQPRALTDGYTLALNRLVEVMR